MSESNNLLLAYPCTSENAPLDPLLAALLPHWQRLDLVVTHLALPLGDADPLAKLLLAVERLPHNSRLVLGGFSLGARIAALAVNSLKTAPCGLLGFGFPFHVHGAPQQQHGRIALSKVSLPTLIVQGSRDPHGTQSEVRSYGPLPPTLSVHWLPGAKHRFAPGPHTQSAGDAAVAFLQKALLSPPA